MSWSQKRENEAATELRKLLKMHPSEFLLSEFVFRNRERLRAGWKMRLNLRDVFSFFKDTSPPQREKVLATYQYLVSRFFRPDLANPRELFELDFKKKRVRELLAEK